MSYIGSPTKKAKIKLCTIIQFKSFLLEREDFAAIDFYHHSSKDFRGNNDKVLFTNTCRVA